MHIVLNCVGLSALWLHVPSAIFKLSFPCISNWHITLCHHCDTWPATAWGYYFYTHITVASQGQILGHCDSARKFVQSVLWFVWNSLHIIWFYLTCSRLISREHVQFTRKILADFHTFSSPVVIRALLIWIIFLYEVYGLISKVLKEFESHFHIFGLNIYLTKCHVVQLRHELKCNSHPKPFFR